METPHSPIDTALAKLQHNNYVHALKQVVPEIIEIPADDSLPDCCFIEDTCVIVGSTVLMSHPGAPTREPEVRAVYDRLKQYSHLTIVQMQEPAHLDGGDVLVTGKEILVGLSARTNESGIEALKKTFQHMKVRHIPVPKEETLHLKSVMSALDENTLIFTDTISGREMAEKVQHGLEDPYEIIFVPDSIAANVLRIRDTVLLQEGFPQSLSIIAPHVQKRNLKLHTINMSELIKADGALTCCSIFLL